MRVRAVAYCSLPIVWMTPADRARQATSCELLCRSSTDFDLSSDYAKVIEQSLEYSPDVKAFSEFDALLEKDFQIPFAALRLDVMFSVSLEDLEITSSDPDKFPVTEAVRH